MVPAPVSFDAKYIGKAHLEIKGRIIRVQNPFHRIRVLLVLSPAMRGGARNRNRTIERNAVRAIDYDYEHEHEQSEGHVRIYYFINS